MMPKLHALLFDLDGTLIDSAPDLQQAINTLLTQEGLAPLSPESVKDCLGDGLRMMLVQAFGLAGRTLEEHDMQRLMPLFDEVYAGIVPQFSCVYAGARELMEKQKAAGVKLALCTNKYETATRRLLKQLDLERYFDAVIGGDTTAKPKPHALPLQRALEIMNAQPENALMIGDHANDVLSARAARMKVIGISGGYTKNWRADAQPDAFAATIAECAEILPRFFA